MKLKTVNLSLSFDELFQIHSLLEDSIEHQIKDGFGKEWLDPVELKMLETLTVGFGYKLSLAPNRREEAISLEDFKKTQYFDNVDDWLEALEAKYKKNDNTPDESVGQ